MVLIVHYPSFGQPATRLVVVDYIVKPGDSLGSILHRIGLSPLWGKRSGFVYKIADQNRLRNVDVIYVGQKLKISYQAKSSELPKDQSDATQIVYFDESEQQESGDQVGNLTSNSNAEELLPADPLLLPLAGHRAGSNATFSGESSFEHNFAEGSSSYLGLNLQYYFTRIDSYSKADEISAQFLTKPGFGFGLLWDQNWNSRFSSSVYLFHRDLIFVPSPSGLVLNRRHKIGEVGTGLAYRFIDSTDFKLAYGFGNQPFARAYSQGVASLETIHRSKLSTSLKHVFNITEPISISLEAGVLFMSSESLAAKENTAKEKIDVGRGYFVIPTLIHHYKPLRLLWSMHYEKQTQSSTGYVQDLSNLGSLFGVQWELR
jgi:hypothetical protein